MIDVLQGFRTLISRFVKGKTGVEYAPEDIKYFAVENPIVYDKPGKKQPITDNNQVVLRVVVIPLEMELTAKYYPVSKRLDVTVCKQHESEGLRILRTMTE
jgi:hypothetical protein